MKVFMANGSCIAEGIPDVYESLTTEKQEFKSKSILQSPRNTPAVCAKTEKEWVFAHAKVFPPCFSDT